MGFGGTLQRLREAAGFSQDELADRAGIPVDSVQNWEQGRTKPRLDGLLKLARALGVAVDDLAAGALDTDKSGKKRGRPAKPKAEAPAPKRPRGRPRKDSQ